MSTFSKKPVLVYENRFWCEIQIFSDCPVSHVVDFERLSLLSTNSRIFKILVKKTGFD